MKQELVELGQFLRQHRDWCLLFIIYLSAWIIPFGWMKEFWLLPHSLQVTQPFVLPGFLLVLWGRRKTIAGQWAKLNRRSQNSAKLKMEGNLSVLIIGCLVYFFSFFSRLTLAAMLGLVLILFGVIFRIYGKRLLRSLAAPCIYLLAIVPWFPEVITGKINNTIFLLHIIFSRIFLKIFKIEIFSINNNILINGITATIDFNMYGANITIAMILFFWGYGLYRQTSRLRIIHMILTGCVISFILHQIRLALVFASVITSPPLSRLLSTANPWIFIILSLVLTFASLKVLARVKRPAWVDHVVQAFSRASAKIQRPVDQLLGKSALAGSRVGGAVSRGFRPLVWVLDHGIRFGSKITTWIGRTNRNLDSRLRKTDRYFRNRKKRR